MTSPGLLRGNVTLTIRGRILQFRKIWFIVGPVLYLIGSAVVGTYLASRNPERFGVQTEGVPAAPSPNAGVNPTTSSSTSDVGV